jgi:hypothetical protein
MALSSAAAALLALLAIPITAGAAEDAASVSSDAELRPFIGLWEGIDPGDGSLTQRSITCTRSGDCRILGADTFFRLCNGKRGIIQGRGAIRQRVLRAPGLTLSCFDGPSVSVDSTYTPDGLNRTLVERTNDLRIKPITFHKISERPPE